MSVNPGNTPGRRRGRGGRARQPRPLPIFEYDDEAKGPQIGRAAASAAAPALPVPAHDGMVVDSAGVPRRRTSVKLFEDDDSTVGAGKGAGEVGAGARGASGVSSVPSLMVPSPYDVPSVGQMLGPVPPPAPPRAPPRDESSSSGGSGSGSGSSSPRAKRLSEVIGFVVSWGSLLSKVPQIANLYRSGSTQGLSLPMFAMELATQTIATLYHVSKRLPLSSYGENVSLGLGNCAILLAFVLYGQKRAPVVVGGAGAAAGEAAGAVVSAGAAGAVAGARTAQGLLGAAKAAVVRYVLQLAMSLPVRFPRLFASPLVQRGLISLMGVDWTRAAAAAALAAPVLALPLLRAPALLAFLQGVRVPVYCVSRLPQIRELYDNKAVGQLSSVSFAINLGGSLARLFTSRHQTQGETLIIAGFWASIVCNVAILAQYAYYTRWPGGR